jgi:phosphatidylserine decarboxylase
MTSSKSYVVPPIEDPKTIPELKLLFENADDTFVAQLELSLNRANDKAKPKSEGGGGELDSRLYAALPLEGMDGRWPTTFDEYANYLAIYSRWIPHQSDDDAWLNPDWVNPGNGIIDEHREVYDYLCWFYWLIDQDLSDGKIIQNVPWFSKFLVAWARLWGGFLDTPDSFSKNILDAWRKDSPRFRIEDSMIPDEWHPGELRSNAPSGWLTYNQFFARELNTGLRPIAHPNDNTTITSPADSTYKRHFAIDENGNIPEITIKGTHTYGNVSQLLETSQYADAFNGGHFVHNFLGPYSYHRFHTPVAGIVKECYPVKGEVYLQVSLAQPENPEFGGQFEAADSAKDGYEFVQARGILTIDTTGSPYGDVGIVAVLPIGMCQVSGVNMTHEQGKECLKGDEFGYFTFGGSDIIVLTQKGTNPVYNPAFVQNTSYYSLYGTSLAKVTPLTA